MAYNLVYGNIQKDKNLKTMTFDQIDYKTKEILSKLNIKNAKEYNTSTRYALEYQKSLKNPLFIIINNIVVFIILVSLLFNVDNISTIVSYKFENIVETILWITYLIVLIFHIHFFPKYYDSFICPWILTITRLDEQEEGDDNEIK